jgi:hypothetical protein
MQKSSLYACLSRVQERLDEQMDTLDQIYARKKINLSYDNSETIQIMNDFFEIWQFLIVGFGLFFD